MSLIQDSANIELSNMEHHHKHKHKHRPKPGLNTLVEVFQSTTEKRQTIIQQLQSQHASFEDSRVTKVILEQYRLIELLRMIMMCTTILLTIISFDLEFIGGQSLTSDAILYLLFFFTILIEMLTVFSFYAIFQCDKASLFIPEQCQFVHSEQFIMMLVEMVVVAFSPFPFTRGIKVPFQTLNDREEHFYHLNEVFSFLIFQRIIIIFQISLKLSDYYTSSVIRVCNFYSVKANIQIVLKVLLRDYPLIAQFYLNGLGIFYFSYLYQFAERPLERIHDTQSDTLYQIESPRYQSYGPSFWITLITIPSVGYGDYYPLTDLGRIIMAACILYGITTTSLLIINLQQVLELDQGERVSSAIMQRLAQRDSIQQQSAIVIATIARFRKLFKPEHFAIKNKWYEISFYIRKMFNLSRALKRQHIEISSENLNDIMYRYFSIFKLECQELLSSMLSLQKQQDTLKKLFHNFHKNLQQLKKEKKSQQKIYQPSLKQYQQLEQVELPLNDDDEEETQAQMLGHYLLSPIMMKQKQNGPRNNSGTLFALFPSEVGWKA